MQPPVGRTYRRLFLVLALVGFFADQVSKYGVFAALYNEGNGGQVEVIHDLFLIEAKYTTTKDPGNLPLSWLRTISGEVLPILNHGALFGIGGRNDRGDDGNHLFTFISLLAAAVIAFWANRPVPAADRFLIITLGLILAGTLGNLYDRVVFGGVRDFLHFFNLTWPFTSIHLPFGLDDWPVFNVADCCLVCGAGLLVLQAVFTRSETEPLSEPAAVAEAQEATSAGV